ncbi:RNA polymerase sigma factor [Spirosoma fluviale]|uniref:RNA polymerase sigma-70 factor, ECF subfamily n=1 Tax=Spirosoma fluviale TaxID=1597977 RepID=A0A286GBH0_9BACT|nr:sigma-70 family RNA polymerase sigma factor [Spirosoma fluviale]SOD92867.1 RNA polymerase sigma-70 factor, ECF subfamily [Spirosoma fluviale]
MAREIPLLKEPQLAGRYDDTPLDFSDLYDRYAAILLGVITRIVSDKELAIELLATTFTRVRLEINTYRSEKQPFFTWLLAIARCTALDALSEQKQAPTRVVQLTPTGQVVPLPTSLPKASVALPTDSTNPKLTQLLHSVLFKNCTPEEAARTLNLPVETARQLLRQAMQQLRTTRQAR